MAQPFPAQRPVLQQGDPRLRQLARPVTQFDGALQTLIDDLLWTAEQTNGVGIAAPQVGVNQRLVIIASRPNLRYPQAPTMAPTALVNPRLVAHSEETVLGWEGCLSVPDCRGQVVRYREIEVEYCDRHGQLQRRVWTDFVARIFQHESDHLDGHLFVDWADAHSLLTEAEYTRRYGA
jgi:peptide deformylase